MPDFAARIASVRLKDGLTNAITGAGTSTDPRAYNFYVHRRMSYQQIESAYRGGWVMRRIIDKPAREMVREWRNWQADPDDVKVLEQAERTLGIRQNVEKALQLAGLGGAGMVLWIKGDDPTQPLDPARIKKDALRKVVVWHRSRFSLGQMITDPDSDWFEQPEYFMLSTRAAGQQVKIHPSRVIAFKGQPVPDINTASWEEAFWGDSTVEVVVDAVANCDTAQNGFAALIKDARNRRVYVPKLLEKTATADGEAKLARRMAAMALGESMFGVTWLDAGATNDDKAGERIEDRQMTWAGMPQMADMYMTAASGAADMPATLLWGKSPDGMNATGESDKDLWEQTIKGKQDLDLRPCLDQLDAVMIPSATGTAWDSDKIGWEYRPLSVQTEAEEAKTFWDFMQGFDILVNSGTVPLIALEKGIQSKLSEARWLPGIDAALNDVPEGERFPSESAADPEIGPDGQPIDPNALTQTNGGKEVIPASAVAPAGNGSASRRRAANDAARFFADAQPRPLYVQRKLLNAGPLIAWAKANGFTSTLPADQMHVTVLYSRSPVDPMKMGESWSGDDKGNVTIKPGGPRAVERLGPSAVVLLFASWEIESRHRSMVEAGGSHDFDSYQPHVTISYEVPADFDLSAVKPYTGALQFGPELFEPLNEDWKSDITEE